MSHITKGLGRGRLIGIAATAVVMGLNLAAIASATAYTVQIARSAVTNQSGSTRSENIAVSSAGFALYELTGDSKSHPECTKSNGCFQFWPPATVKSAQHLTKAPGVPGTLGVWRRNGFIQLTLSGHPLYRYFVDTSKHTAKGQGVKSFGGTWHVIPQASSSSGSGSGW